MIRKRLADKGLGDSSTAEWDFGEIHECASLLGANRLLFQLIFFFLCASLDQSVRDDVAVLRASPYVATSTNVRGFVLDLMGDGKLREVESQLGSQ